MNLRATSGAKLYLKSYKEAIKMYHKKRFLKIDNNIMSFLQNISILPRYTYIILYLLINNDLT